MTFLLLSMLSFQGEDAVWISLDAREAVEIATTLTTLGAEIQLAPVGKRQRIAAARIARSDLPALSHLMHDRFGRCGGFRVHADRTEALAVNATIRRLEKLGHARAFDLANPVTAALMRDAVDENHIVDVITMLSSFPNRYYDSQAGIDAALWLRDYWTDLTTDRDDVTVTTFDHSGFPQPSVILEIRGHSTPDEIVVLGGHLDSTLRWGEFGNSPGADDNASGIACLSEVIRVIATTGFRPSRTLRFMGFAGEEHGLLGSDEIAESYATAGVDVVAMLQLDMTNYQGSGDDIWLMTDNSDTALTAFLGRLIDSYLPELTRNTTACGYACSDHASWHFAGFPAAMPSEARFGAHNPNLHTTSDTLAVSGNRAEHAVKFAALASVFVAELGAGDTVADTSRVRPDVTVMTRLLKGYGPCAQPGDCPRDINGDGRVDEADLAVLTDAWHDEICLGFIPGPACSRL